MESINTSYSTRGRVASLGQLQPEHAVRGHHLREAGGRLEVAAGPGEDDLGVVIGPDAVRSTKGSMNNVFLPTEQTVGSRLLSSWHRGGVWAVLSDLADGEGTAELPRWVGRLAGLLAALIRFPLAGMTPGSAVAGAEDGGALVRRLAWHPHTPRLAVALADDSVRVYQARRPTVPLLKHRLQRQVADLHWKPHSASLLAVACARCVLVWTLEPSSVVTRPSGSCCQSLMAPGHAPVTSVQWSPTGDLLLSASPADGALLLWRVADEASVPLRRLWRLGNTFCRWSPDASRVLTATTGDLFRVWETARWTDERWRSPASGGPVRAACWSPDGRVALIATASEPVEDEATQPPLSVAAATVAPSPPGGMELTVVWPAVIFALSFVPVLLTEAAPKPVPVIDLATCQLTDHRGVGFRAGGQVSALAWDGSGRRLAVALSDSGCVAVFCTELKPHLRVTPCGVIRPPEEQQWPVTVAFQLNLADAASLSIAWSGGRVQQVPMLCTRTAPSVVADTSLFGTPSATPVGKAVSSLLSPAASALSPAMSPGRLQLFSVGTP